MRQISDQLNGKRAVVTGGGAGLGRVIAETLASRGARVAIMDVDLAQATATQQHLASRGTEALCFAGSVADSSQVRSVFSAIETAWGGTDILINNAGISGNRPALDLSDEEWRRCMSINLDGVFYCAREAGRMMHTSGGGTIINIGSIYSIVAAPNRVHYCASKAGVEMLTRSLAIEWAEHAIRVNCIAPGYVETALLKELAESGRVDLERIRQRTPQKRLATPEDIAKAVVWMCSDDASHVTGQTLAIDGGWTANGYI